MSDPLAELKKILANPDDNQVRIELHTFLRHWEPKEKVAEAIALIEQRGKGWCPAQPSWIERACSGEDEPRMRLAWSILFVTPYTYKIRGKKLDDEHIARLCASPDLGNVWKLSTLVSSQFGPRAFAALSEAATMRLRELDVPHGKPGKTGLTALGNGSALTALEKLDLADCKIDGKGVEAMLRGGALSSLRQLALSRNLIGAQGTRALASSATLGRLEKLELSDCQLDSAALDALCAGSSLASLSDLSLSNNPALTPATLDRLASSSLIPRLQRLVLDRVRADGGFLRALAAAKPARLTTLSLRSSHLVTDDVELLVGGSFPALTALSISGSLLGAEGARRLASSPLLGRLESLDVSDCGLGDEGILALAAAPSLASLTSLSASGNGGSLGSWHALRDAPSLQPEVRRSIDDGSRYLS